jgi:Chloroplast import apparatus Tic20-like
MPDGVPDRQYSRIIGSIIKWRINMVWRGSSTPQDRFLACLTYLVPLIEALQFGSFLFMFFPPIAILFLPLIPVANLYFYSIGGLPVIEFVVFIGLYIGVVRNESLHHFLRFNAMQALMVAVSVYLFSALLRLLGFAGALVPTIQSPAEGPLAMGLPILLGITFSIVFLAVVGVVGYSVFQCIRGRYAEIPILSEAAYTQTRF